MSLALTFDTGLAASIARDAKGDEALRRKLWLAIAKHAIEEGAALTGGGPPQVNTAPCIPPEQHSPHPSCFPNRS